MKIKRILVATDFSSAGTHAVQEAAAWAGRTGAALRVVHVVPPARWLKGPWGRETSDLAVLRRNAADVLRRAAEAIPAAARAEMSTALLSGRASREIMRAARDFKCDLLVVGAVGERGRLSNEPTLGGTAAKLVASTKVPLLIVRTPPKRAPVRVLAAVDLTPVSHRVMDWAAAAAADGELGVLHVYEVPFAARLQAYSVATAAINVYAKDEQDRRELRLGDLLAFHDEPRPVPFVVRGDAIKQLFSHIEKFSATLVVLGQHARRKPRDSRASFGSVCRYATTFARINALIVPGS